MNNNYMSLVSLLEDKVQKQPDLQLYTFLQDNGIEHNSLTYRELAEQAKKIATALQEVSQPGDRALLIYPPGLDLIAAFFGCLYAGVIAVPVYPPSSKDLVAKIQHIINSAGTKVALTNQSILQQIRKLRVAKWLSHTPLINKAAEQIIGSSFNRSAQLCEWEFEKLRFITTDHLSIDSVDKWRHPDVNPEHLAFLQYTSGSTGKPKGVMVSHGNLLHNSFAIQKQYGLSERDIGVLWLPPYHDMGLIGGILQAFYTSFPLKIMSPFTFLQRPAIWLESISRYHATMTGAPNFAYDLCVAKISEEIKDTLDLSCWEIAASGAEPIRSATVERFSKTFARCGFRPTTFYPCYGLAEATLMVTGAKRGEGVKYQVVDNEALGQGKVVYCDEAHSKARRLVNCGTAVDNFQIVIVNPETLTECHDGQIGEVWVASKSVTQGYWQLLDETQHNFNARLSNSEQPFLRTGDLGYIDNGSLYVTGRLKDMIIIRGRNYYPHDIEQTTHTCHPNLRVNCCAVFALEENEKELLVVVQELKETAKDNDLEAITRQIRSSILKTHGISPDIVVLAGHKSVPKTTSGKIQRNYCKKKYLEGKLNVIYIDSAIQQESRPSSANSLQHIFNKPLDELDSQKKLTELGMDSLKLVELQYVLSNITQRVVPMEYLLTDPSLKDIKALIEGKVELQELAHHHQVDLAAELAMYQVSESGITNLAKHPPQQAFLTGATGFLGAYLLKELLDNTTWQISCLVKAESEQAGLNRISNNLASYGLWQPAFASRITVVRGDLEKTRLGLAEQVWEKLASEIDIIFHSAAQLNFVYPYQKLKTSNVLGTRTILELAGCKQLKAVHYISTVGYFMSADLADDTVVTEQTELSLADGIYGGYNQSKWLAEKLVINARKNNIPTTVYRPSLITGDSQTGRWNQADVVCRVLKGCIQLQARPQLDVALNFVPVDYVAKAITCLAIKAPYRQDIFHLNNPASIKLEQLFEYINDNGFKVEAVSYDVWKKRLLENCNHDADNPLYPLLPFFLEKNPTKDASLFDLYMLNNKARIDCSYTKQKLAEHAIFCASMDVDLISRYLNYLVDCGYLIR